MAGTFAARIAQLKNYGDLMGRPRQSTASAPCTKEVDKTQNLVHSAPAVHGAQQGREGPMSHMQAVRQLIKSLISSAKNHAVIIDGPPGWGKTTTVELALSAENAKAVYLGSYSTPLNLYNFLLENHEKIVVIDDSAGLFIDSASMAILKAATWASPGAPRVVRWGSTSNRALATDFVFKGKFILICNSFPSTPDGEAIRSRSYIRPIKIAAAEGKQRLLEAAKNKKWFKQTKLASTVAEFLSARLTDETIWKISYRTLEQGYELAIDHPEHWQDLLAPQLPIASEDPLKLVKQLSKQNIKVKDQVRLFEEATGMSRRTFFKYRQEASLTRSR
jgi:hypothetical protein